MESPSPTSLRARIRWGNVARALALVALAALVALWPRLRAPEPVLPPAEAVPVVAQAPAAGASGT
ncbi:MAG: hypothetical protein M3P39_09350, partial [Actinomycetota bacterium]|nr:hypothetical protein [Actinomycetota bacterium]